MRYPIKLSNALRPFFSVFGFRRDTSYVELGDTDLQFRYGTADEVVPLDNIEGGAPRAWPFIYGLGAKIGPDGGVAYVGSLDGVIQIRFKSPVALNVWGPFRNKKAKCVTVSMVDADGFMSDLNARLSERRDSPRADSRPA